MDGLTTQKNKKMLLLLKTSNEALQRYTQENMHGSTCNNHYTRQSTQIKEKKTESSLSKKGGLKNGPEHCNG